MPDPVHNARISSRLPEQLPRPRERQDLDADGPEPARAAAASPDEPSLEAAGTLYAGSSQTADSGRLTGVEDALNLVQALRERIQGQPAAALAAQGHLSAATVGALLHD